MTWKNQIEQIPRERIFTLLWEKAEVTQLPRGGWTMEVPIEESGSTLYWETFSTKGRAEIALAEKQDAGRQLELGV